MAPVARTTAARALPTARGERRGHESPFEHPTGLRPCRAGELFIKSINMTDSLNPPLRRHRRRGISLAALGVAALAVLGACGSSSGGTSSDSSASAGSGARAASSESVTLRLGYFPNITHATALVGVGKGILEEHLAPNVTLETSTFNSGTEASEALFADAIDMTYIGPNPAINAYAKSKGEAVRIISGATSGGAFLVVKPDINSAADLKGQKLASPSLGNTQDVALRSWLRKNGLSADEAGGGDVSIAPQDNSQTLQTFISGDIQGAWVPEPWATRLVQEGGGKVLVDERDLWPGGKYVTTHLMVATKFLKDHPDVVKQFLEGQVAANAWVNANGTEAQTIANDEIGKITGKPLKPEVIAAAWPNLTFTDDPIASSLITSAKAAVDVGLLKPVDNLQGIYDLKLLNEVLKSAGEREVSDQ
jgi:NitT/TauT family transport system substrate-binding protein